MQWPFLEPARMSESHKKDEDLLKQALRAARNRAEMEIGMYRLNLHHNIK